jgi:hypothetical protein
MDDWAAGRTDGRSAWVGGWMDAWIGGLNGVYGLKRRLTPAGLCCGIRLQLELAPRPAGPCTYYYVHVRESGVALTRTGLDWTGLGWGSGIGVSGSFVLVFWGWVRTDGSVASVVNIATWQWQGNQLVAKVMGYSPWFCFCFAVCSCLLRLVGAWGVALDSCDGNHHPRSVR